MTYIDANKTDVVIGKAVVPYDAGKNRWALPNRKHTQSKSTAIEYAKIINAIIERNSEAKQ